MPSRLGLIGYSCRTGLGELNRQLAHYVPVSHWLVFKHCYRGVDVPLHTPYTVHNSEHASREVLIDRMDRVVFCERPPDGNNWMLGVCRGMKKPMFCVPMYEWLPVDAFNWGVRSFLCPTHQSYELLKTNLPCVYFPWPVDTRRFQFQKRNVCRRFVFINGNGGWKGRKGGAVIKQLLQKWPDIPIVVYSQKKLDWVQTSSPAHNQDLYREGDVLLAPHSVDGIGLEFLEAAASGMPVISTDGEPWNEYPALARVGASRRRQTFGRCIDYYEPNAEHLLAICKRWLGKDISDASVSARQWAEARSWEDSVSEFMSAIEVCA